MNQYTIFCTESQTKKALELDAPIKYAISKNVNVPKTTTIDNVLYCIPTTEEMIGWLETQGVLIQVEPINGMHYYWLLRTKELIEKPDKYSWVIQYVTPGYKEIPSRKEAILVAIDAALEYLIKNKKDE